MRGLVRAGINNIYTVFSDGREIECRIKGKVMKEQDEYYNPIAVGDYVNIEPDPYSAGRGNIISLETRANALIRWNKKKKRIQTIASNVDWLLIVSSVGEPPFRPRFIDRMLIAGLAGSVEPMIVLNKADLGVPGEVAERLRGFRAIGYPVFIVSAKTGEGLPAFTEAIASRTTVFAGQSGVGKTSLLNAIEPGLGLKVGAISAKYGKGAHTTSYASMITLDAGFSVIDTPGIRELDIANIEPEELKFYFPEFHTLAESCSYPSCLHRHEPGCAVKTAVENDEIIYDRYESYLRILADLEERRKAAYD